MFGRRKDEPIEDAPSTTVEERVARPGGKGRPTPSRKEAEAARQKRLAPPRTRKEASALRREKGREGRAAQRAALNGSGDDRYLPARDQGPVKKYLRDFVDSRRTIGEFLLPLFFVVFVLVYVNQEWARRFSSSVFLAVILLLVVDSFRIARGSKKGVRERFGADEVRGTTMYSLLRSWQMRRLRLPKPRLRAGDPIP